VEEMKVFENHCCYKGDRISDEEDACSQDSEMGMRLGSSGSEFSFDTWHATEHDVVQRQDCR